jgi:hypothetical protein
VTQCRHYRPLISRHDHNHPRKQFHTNTKPSIQDLRFTTTFRIRLSLLNLLLDLCVLVVIILTRVGDLVLEDLDELVEDDGEDGTDGGSGPVNPVLFVEDAGDDAGAETTSGVERAASVVDTNEFGDEEGETDTDGCDEGGCDALVSCNGYANECDHTFVFLLCQHEDREHQFCRQHRFDKHSLSQTRPRTERRSNIERRRKQHTNKVTCEDTASNLRSHE